MYQKKFALSWEINPIVEMEFFLEQPHPLKYVYFCLEFYFRLNKDGFLE